jgi:hypothetical protein
MLRHLFPFSCAQTARYRILLTFQLMRVFDPQRSGHNLGIPPTVLKNNQNRQGAVMKSENRYRSMLLRVLSPLPVVALISVALLLNTLPHAAESQINGRIISPPSVSAISQSAHSAAAPKAPVQVAMPVPPPMRYVPGLEEPLVSTGPLNDQENKDLDAALVAFHDAPAKAGQEGDYDDYAKPLLAFIEAHPQSNWNAALYTNIGFGYYHAGYYSRIATERAAELTM